MDPIFEPNAHMAGPDPSVVALLFSSQDDSPQIARIPAAQPLLFPSNPRAVCQEIGLNWLAAVKLGQDGWLSFAPEKTSKLDEAQEAELRFIGSLAVAGCDHDMLSILLANLPRPYAYDSRRLFFDWQTRRWRVLPDPKTLPEAAFTDWLEVLVQTSDASTLTGIAELANDALARVRAKTPSPAPGPASWRDTNDEEEMQG